MMPHFGRVETRQAGRFLFPAIVGYFVLRLTLLFHPGHTFDLDLYKEWLIKTGEFGLAKIYQTSSMDYPPLYAYILEPLAWIYSLLSRFGVTGGVVLTVLVKLPPMLFDLAIGGLLWRCGCLKGVSVGNGGRLAMTAAYLLNPAVLFDIAYWGQPDSIYSFFSLAAFVIVGCSVDRSASSWHSETGGYNALVICLAWGLLTLAALMKPLALPYFPFLLLLTVLVSGLRGVMTGMIAAIAVALAVFFPFLLSGEGSEVLRRVFSDLGAMPFTSANAHNLWWALGVWQDSEVPLIGHLTATHIGLVLFGISYVLLSWAIYRRWVLQNSSLLPVQILAGAGMVGFSFFIFSTHLHENHLFAIVALWSPLILEPGVWRKAFICTSLGVFINCVLHDPAMDHPFWPFTIGGSTRILHPPYLDRPYYVGELVALWLSVMFNLGVYGWALVGVLRPGSRNWLLRLWVSRLSTIS